MELYTAQPKQLLFHNATADEVLFGGAAGGGKSEAILWDAVGKCLSTEGVRVSVFRRTYPELEKSIILNFLKKVPIDIREYSKKEHRAFFPSTKSHLEFNHVQYEQDVFKFQSAEYDYIYFDELTHFTEFIYRYLMSRLRTTTKGLKPQIKSASNPGNVGHLWVKKRFIDGVKPYDIVQKLDDEIDIPATFTAQFIPAKVYDNKVLMDADPNYVKRLELLPEDERRALLDGDWDVFKGQYFKMWRYDKHVVEAFEIPRSWRRFGAMDWGYSKPSCFLWFAVSPDDTLYCYRELYEVENSATELAKKIKAMSVYHDDRSTPEHLDYIVADPSLWSVSQFERGESIAYKLVESGIPVTKADNNRLSGWDAMRDYMFWNDDIDSNLKFFDNCKNSIRTIPALVYDDRRPEDLDTNGEDHAADACRYGIMSNPSPKVTKIKKKSTKLNTFDRHLKEAKRKKRMTGYVGSR